MPFLLQEKISKKKKIDNVNNDSLNEFLIEFFIMFSFKCLDNLVVVDNGYCIDVFFYVVTVVKLYFDLCLQNVPLFYRTNFLN